LTLNDEILIYLHNEKGIRNAGQIKKNTSASQESHFVLLDALNQLEANGKIRQVSKYNFEYCGNGDALRVPIVADNFNLEQLVKDISKTEPEETIEEHFIKNPTKTYGEEFEDLKAKNEELKLKESVVVDKTVPTTNAKYDVAPNGVKILKIDANLYRPKAQVEYIPRDGELTKLEAHFNDGYPLLIEGEKGIAKTLLIRYFCWKHNIPIITLDCHAQVDTGDMIGHFVLHEQETLYVLGVIPTAIKIANEIGACCICFEEFNAMSQEMQKGTNPLLDDRKEVAVHDTGEIYRLKEGAKLLTVGTMNLGEGYGGIFNLNEECNSRWCREHLEYGTVEHNTQVLKSRTKLDDVEIERLLSLATSLRASDKISFKPCTRELVMFGQVLESYKKFYKNPKHAYAEAFKTTIVNRYSDNIEAYDFAVSEIKSAFGVTIK
jgi:nitric oxide reductase NorQ protein